MKFPLFSIALASAALFLTSSVNAQIATPVPTARVLGSANVDCDVTGGPFVYLINSTLRFENTIISQDLQVWFSADHQYCLTIRAPAYCNILQFFNGQVVNGQHISLPAVGRIRSVVLGGTPNVTRFSCP